MADQLMPGSSPSIADHGLIGDLQTAALVTHRRDRSTGSAARGSTRRASSASCSTTERAATSGSARRHRDYATKQLYFPDTAILITRFLTEDGVGEVVDFMPIDRRDGHRPAPARPDGALRPRRR